MIVTEKPEALSQTDFAMLGMNDIAFVKPVPLEDKAGVGYAIHAADGTQMAVVNNRELAFAAIRQHDLEAVDVH